MKNKKQSSSPRTRASKKQDDDKWADRPNHIPWPPLFYAAAVAGGFLLQHFFIELPWLPSGIGDILFMLGVLLVPGALFIDIRSLIEIRKHRTTIMPNRPVEQLVTSGPFSVSRNPIYIAHTMTASGIGLVFGNWWIIGGAILAAIATNYFGVLREEAHLEAKFGSQFHKYKKKVKRWI